MGTRTAYNTSRVSDSFPREVALSCRAQHEHVSQPRRCFRRFGSPQEALRGTPSYLKTTVPWSRSLEALARAAKEAWLRTQTHRGTERAAFRTDIKENTQEDSGSVVLAGQAGRGTGARALWPRCLRGMSQLWPGGDAQERADVRRRDFVSAVCIARSCSPNRPQLSPFHDRKASFVARYMLFWLSPHFKT